MCYPRLKLQTNERDMTSCALEVVTPFKSHVVAALRRQNPRMTQAHAVRAHAFLVMGCAVSAVLLLVLLLWWRQNASATVNINIAGLLLRSDSSGSWDVPAETNRTI
jgi:hypothetical protein